MSRFFCGDAELKPYVPGEQPKDREYIKLNTNENPYPPSMSALRAVTGELLAYLKLYSDPECSELKKAIAEFYSLSPRNILPVNGSDEALAFCFMAFGGCGVTFPDITYGFYRVLSQMFRVPSVTVPLEPDFTVPVQKFIGCGRTVVLANPNAQTGIELDRSDIVRIIEGNPDNVVVIDEAYIDFGGTSAVELVDTYDNLIVVQTMSKSRALAGARIGYAVACEQLIADLDRVRNCFNPYNVNSVSAAMGAVAMRDRKYFKERCAVVVRLREILTEKLQDLGYTVLPSHANFVLAKSPKLGGEYVYSALKAAGVLVRHFNDGRIKDYVRITVGTGGDIDALVRVLEKIERGKGE